MSRSIASALAIAVCVTVSTGPVRAQSSTAGVRVAPAHAGSESQPRIISDHAGGAFVGFVGEQDTLYAARLRSDATPDPAWTALKVRQVNVEFPSGSRIAWLRPGTIVAFSDLYWGLPDTTNFLYRPTSDTGIVQPDYSGQSFIAYLSPALVEQPNGTVLAASLANDPNTNIAQLRVAYVANDGGLVEGFLTTLTGRATAAQVCRAIPADGGGAWTVSEVYGIAEGISNDLVAARILATGGPALTPNFRVISNAARDQKAPALATDGAGGMIVAWQDARNLATGEDVYAMRLLADGSLAAGWTAGGKVICNATGTQTQPAIASDGAGGVWIAWADSRSGEADIYFTHVLANGTLAAGFPPGGLALCAVTGGQVEVQLAADGAGGCFALWLDQRDGETDLFGLHMAANASMIAGWAAGGSPICTHPTFQKSPRLLTLDSHRALAVWADARSGPEQIYVATLTDQVLSAPPLGAAALSLRAARAPAYGEVELWLGSAGGPVEVALLDVSGRVVARETVDAEGSAIPVRFRGRSVPPGLYLARASQGARHANCRVVILK